MTHPTHFQIGDYVTVKSDELYQKSVPRWEDMHGIPQRVIGVRSDGDIELLARPNYWYMSDAWELVSREEAK